MSKIRRRSTVHSDSDAAASGGPHSTLTPLQKAAKALSRHWNFANRRDDTSANGSRRRGGGSAFARLEADEHFPSYADLQLMPSGVRATMEAAALTVIQNGIMPVFACRLRLRARRAICDEVAHRNGGSLGKPTAQTLLSIPSLFHRWSDLGSVIDAFRPIAFLKGEVIVHERESHITGMYVVGVGRVDPCFGAKQTGAPSVVAGDENLITQQPHRKTIRCVSDECVVWHLPFVKFAEVYSKQSPEVKKHLEEVAMSHRGANMKVAYKHLTTVHALRRHRDFATFNDTALAAILTKAQARVFREGARLYEPDEIANSLYILLCGTVRIEREDPASSAPAPGRRRRLLSKDTALSSDGPDVMETSVLSASASPKRASSEAPSPFTSPRTTEYLHPMTVFGSMSWIQNLPRHAAAVAETAVDVLVVHRDAIKADLAAAPKHTVPRLYPGDDDASSLRYLPYARDIPFLMPSIEDASELREARLKEAALLSRAALMAAAQGLKLPVPVESPARRRQVDLALDPQNAVKEVAAALTLRIHEAGATLFGTAEQCNRIIIPISGRAKLLAKEGPVQLAINEAVGFSLLVPHRWCMRCVVTHQMETLEVTYDVYHAILATYGLVGRVMGFCNALMFPDAAKPSVLEVATAATAKLKNPRLFPLLSLEQIAHTAATDPLPGVVPSPTGDHMSIVKAVSTGECRIPSSYQLKKLEPIPVRTGAQSMVFSSASKARIMSNRVTGTGAGSDNTIEEQSLEPIAVSVRPGQHFVEPLVLGRHHRVTFGYGDLLPPSNKKVDGTTRAGRNGPPRRANSSLS